MQISLEVFSWGFLVSEAARKALWACLADEPTLLIRFFFEKLSQKERRVKRIFLCPIKKLNLSSSS